MGSHDVGLIQSTKALPNPAGVTRRTLSRVDSRRKKGQNARPKKSPYTRNRSPDLPMVALGAFRPNHFPAWPSIPRGRVFQTGSSDSYHQEVRTLNTEP
jgi:hypothetical protein